MIILPGQCLTIILPSGKEINIECTQDTSSVFYEDYVLFNEDLIHGSWEQDWPHLEIQPRKCT